MVPKAERQVHHELNVPQQVEEKYRKRLLRCIDASRVNLLCGSICKKRQALRYKKQTFETYHSAMAPAITLKVKYSMSCTFHSRWKKKIANGSCIVASNVSSSYR